MKTHLMAVKNLLPFSIISIRVFDPERNKIFVAKNLKQLIL